MKFQVEEATREQTMLRMALSGPAGTGKTITSLKIARALVGPEGVVVLADTEFASASKYAPARGAVADNESTFSFKRIPISGRYDPRDIQALIDCAVAEKASVLIIDSMTHFWNGVGGFLELVDEEVKRQKSKGNKPDSFTAWKEIDPVYKRMVQALLGAPLHIICTLRAKTEYEKVSADGGSKGRVTKIGMAPEMRDHFQYEMDIEGMLDMEHNLVIGKTRCSALDGRVFNRPGADVAKILRSWLDTGDAPKARPTQAPSAAGSSPAQTRTAQTAPKTASTNEAQQSDDAPSGTQSASHQTDSTKQTEHGAGSPKKIASDTSPAMTAEAPVTPDQKARMMDLVKELGIAEKPGAFIMSLNGGEKLETAAQAAAVIAEFDRRIAVKKQAEASAAQAANDDGAKSEEQPPAGAE